MSGKREQVKYFCLSFSAGFFVFSLMFLFLITTSHPKTPQSLRAADIPAEEEYIPDGNDAITLLIFGTASPDDIAGTYILARFDPVAGRVSVAALPPQTVITSDSRQETLEEAYRYGGARYTLKTLSGYLGVPIHRYARLSAHQFILAAEAVGVVEFDLTQDVTLTEGDAAFTLSAGRQLLDGRKAAGIIQCRNLEGGELERCEITARLTCAIINQRIDVVSSTLADKIFSTVVNLIDTDISYLDYEQRKGPAIQMARNGGEIANPVKIEGIFSEDATRLILPDTTLARIIQAFL